MYSQIEVLNMMFNIEGWDVLTSGTNTPDAGKRWVTIETDTDSQFSAVCVNGDNLPDATRIEGRLLVNGGGISSITVTSGRLLVGYKSV